MTPICCCLPPLSSVGSVRTAVGYFCGSSYDNVEALRWTISITAMNANERVSDLMRGRRGSGDARVGRQGRQTGTPRPSPRATGMPCPALSPSNMNAFPLSLGDEGASSRVSFHRDALFCPPIDGDFSSWFLKSKDVLPRSLSYEDASPWSLSNGDALSKSLADEDTSCRSQSDEDTSSRSPANRDASSRSLSNRDP